MSRTRTVIYTMKRSHQEKVAKHQDQLTETPANRDAHRAIRELVRRGLRHAHAVRLAREACQLMDELGLSLPAALDVVAPPVRRP